MYNAVNCCKVQDFTTVHGERQIRKIIKLVFNAAFRKGSACEFIALTLQDIRKRDAQYY